MSNAPAREPAPTRFSRGPSSIRPGHQRESDEQGRRGRESLPPQLRKEAIPTPRPSRSLVAEQLHGSLQKPQRRPGCHTPLRELGLVWICSVRMFFIYKTRFCLLSRRETLSLSLPKPGIKKRGSVKKKKIHRKRKYIHSTVLYLVIL